MPPTVIDVVVRCRNEMPHLRAALDQLQRQEPTRARILFMDCGSTDGSREEAARRGLRLLDVDPTTYRPGAVLNRAMRSTCSAIVAFVNGDAIARSSDALQRLVDPFGSDPTLGATYGRQLARPEAGPLVKNDYQRAFGPRAAVALRHGRFFSMAASAIRRDAWSQQAFDENLRYSEDVEWTTRLADQEWTTRYVPEARFEHSHDYSPRQSFDRRAGEGAADAFIHGLPRAHIVADLLVPLAGAVLRDGRAGVLSPRSLAIRAAEAGGYFVGRRGRR